MQNNTENEIKVALTYSMILIARSVGYKTGKLEGCIEQFYMLNRLREKYHSLKTHPIESLSPLKLNLSL